MMKHKLALVIASLLGANACFAASTASATLGPISLVLTDLDLKDGVEPHVAFGNPTFGAAEAYARAFVGVDPESQQQVSTSIIPFYPVSATISFGPGTSAASIASSSSASTASFFASGGMSDFAGPSGQVAVYEAQSGQAEYGHRFVLSANTQLSVSAEALVSLTATGPGQTNSFATLLLIDHLGTVSQDQLSIVINPTTGETLGGSNSRTLSVLVSNLSDSPIEGYFSFGTSVHGEVYASPIPEPTSQMMLLAGLGIYTVGAARRRLTPRSS